MPDAPRPPRGSDYHYPLVLTSNHQIIKRWFGGLSFCNRLVEKAWDPKKGTLYREPISKIMTRQEWLARREAKGEGYDTWAAKRGRDFDPRKTSRARHEGFKDPAALFAARRQSRQHQKWKDRAIGASPAPMLKGNPLITRLISQIGYGNQAQQFNPALGKSGEFEDMFPTETGFTNEDLWGPAGPGADPGAFDLSDAQHDRRRTFNNTMFDPYWASPGGSARWKVGEQERQADVQRRADEYGASLTLDNPALEPDIGGGF